MSILAIFGVSALMSLVSSGVIAQFYVWPRIRNADRGSALIPLLAPHMFLRFIGLSFLVPGVVSSSLPAAYGDFVAGLFAIVATVALFKHAPWALAAVWLFNIWGAADLLFALYQGPRVGIGPGALGAAFFIPTAIVPPLLVTHFLVFRLLVQPKRMAAGG